MLIFENNSPERGIIHAKFMQVNFMKPEYKVDFIIKEIICKYDVSNKKII